MMLTATSFDLEQTDRLLTTTRSVRKRLDLTRPVPREIILECLRIALQAPSGQNIQPWRWLVIDDSETKRQIGELYRKSHDPYHAAGKALIEQSGRHDMDGIMDSSAYLSAHMHEVPVLVIPCLLAPITPETSPADVAGFYGSILPATWSFMLALRTRGIGAAWTTLHLNYEKEAAAVLGIPDTVTQVAMIPVAYYTGEDFKPARRRPIEEVTYFNGWKKR
jgi:nitroreductase